MNKRIGLSLISEAYPKPLARWNCEAIYKEMCNFIKEHKMQEKVTLKVGDILAKTIDYVNHPIMTIVRFEADKIILNHDGGYWRRDLTQHGYKFYVNGEPYASENIIVPDFKKENKMEYQEITPENIAEVLEFNKSLGLKVDNIRIEDNCICFNFNGYKQEFEFDDDGDTKWLQHTEIETGKLKPLPKANPFDVVKVGDWVRSKKTLYHYQCQLPYRTKDKWYQRVELNNKKCFVCNSNGSGYSSSDSPCDWDLTDIRDYNPTECELKIGDEIHFYNDLKYSITEINHIESKFYLGESKSITFYFGENHKIKSVNGKKYDTIIIPKFDFAQCLVDAGFKIADDCLYVGKSFDDALIWFNSSTGRLNVGMYIKPTPANAQIIVSMANLAKGLK